MDDFLFVFWAVSLLSLACGFVNGFVHSHVYIKTILPSSSFSPDTTDLSPARSLKALSIRTNKETSSHCLAPSLLYNHPFPQQDRRPSDPRPPPKDESKNEEANPRASLHQQYDIIKQSQNRTAPTKSNQIKSCVSS
ncbi:hypothetical protein DL98DRAFT_215418 [Cadophora sp. DSE1049]|nr:hypothetical protein DL98DRAFT_215418 [Cadophora sp. DSE1049]